MPKGPQPKAHRERAQPAARSRLGLLEKHSDYVKRAQDFHRKDRTIKGLKIRAQYKNPNEFAFGMIKSRIAKDGTHRTGPEARALPVDVVKIMKSQDLSYVRMMKKVNQGHLEKLIGKQAEDENAIRPKKVTFYDSDDDIERIITQKADSLPEKEDASSEDESSKLTEAEQAEVKVRLERLEKLRLAERLLETQRLSMAPGKKEKIGVDQDGVPIYKWAQARKK